MKCTVKIDERRVYRPICVYLFIILPEINKRMYVSVLGCLLSCNLNIVIYWFDDVNCIWTNTQTEQLHRRNVIYSPDPSGYYKNILKICFL